MSNPFTAEQLREINEAQTSWFLDIESHDAFSIALLEAAKCNDTLSSLTVTMSNAVSSEVLDAIVDLLATNSSIRDLSFDGVSGDNKATNNKNDYTTLITVPSRSTSVQSISLKKDLPFELEEAIMVILKQTSLQMALSVTASSFVVKHAIALLATGNSLYKLFLWGADCGGTDSSSLVRDGIRNCQSLKELIISEYYKKGSLQVCLEGLDGNESLELLCLDGPLDSEEALLLTKVVSSHCKLKDLTLTEGVPSECMDALCDAVSMSRSIKKFATKHHSNDLAISRMLQKSTSLQEVDLQRDADSVDMIKIAAGLMACKTLTSFSCSNWRTYNLKAIWALVDALIVNHNLCNILPKPYWPYGATGTEERVRKDRNCEKTALTEAKFYLAFNKQGRSLLGSNVPACVWPYALEKVGRSCCCDALYYFIQEAPELFMQ